MSTYTPLTIAGLSVSESDALNGCLKELSDREPRNQLRASFYDGKHAARQVGSIIPQQYWRLGLTLGWSGKAVDALARRCHLDRFVWPDGELDDLGAAVVWDENLLGSEIDGAIVSSLIHGPAFLINTRGMEGEPESLIHVRDARQAAGLWDSRRRILSSAVSVTARNDNKAVTGFVLYLDGLTVIGEKRPIGWKIERTDHRYGMPVEPLVYKPRPGRPLGSSRITRPIMAIHEAALRDVIRLEAHNDIYSIPDLWMFGADESIFKNADGTQKAMWQVMMGRIKGVPDDEDAENPRADAKQFQAASPEPHLASLNAHAKLFAREASLPDTAVAITDVSNPTSAESYDASQYELIAEAEGSTDDWSRPLRRSFIRALAIKNALPEIPPEWRSLEPKWRDPRYLSRAAQADAGLKQLQAIPWLAESDVGLELVGLDEQQIRRALADKRRMGGSAALRAITEAATAGRPAVTRGDDA